MGDFVFIRGKPAAMLRKDGVLVVGDLHIGVESKLRREGIYFPDASEMVASEINGLCKEHGLGRVLFLGDIKESVGNPPTEEANAIRTFFRLLEGKRMMVARGNHDAGLAALVGRMGLDIEIRKEFIIGDYAAVHGNAWPSEEAMQKDALISGHIHPVLMDEGAGRKVWIVAGPGPLAKRSYGNYNKRIRLIIAPAFSSLVFGRGIDGSTKRRVPAFANGIFDFDGAEVRNLDGRKIGRVRDLI